MGKTKIEWATDSWSPVRGCTRVSEGCRNCYAERMAARFCDNSYAQNPFVEKAQAQPFVGFVDPKTHKWTGRVELIESQLEIPLHWRKPCRIFVNSMSDTWHETLRLHDIARVYAVMALAGWHTYMVLTKRPEIRRAAFASSRFREVVEKIRDDMWDSRISYDPSPLEWPLHNVWEGVSVENRFEKHRIDKLRETPAALRFLSLEPLLEDLGALDLRGIGWVIVGGESGPGARPCRVEWIKSVVEQCAASGTACFVKQLGSHAILDLRYDRTIPGATRRLRDRKGGDPREWPEHLRVRELPGQRESAKERQDEH